MQIETKPGLFIGLIGASLALLLGLVGLLTFFRVAWTALVVVAVIIAMFGLLSLGALLFLLKSGKDIPWVEWPIQMFIKLLYPVALRFGTAFGVERERIQGSYIQVHNRLANLKQVVVRPEQILVLVPHCLQHADCQVKVTTEVQNCLACGRCKLADLLDLKARYGCNLIVATGGTVARRVIKELCPRVIVAVACERDLASGIQDVHQIHVVGVTNERPQGPCVNTSVDVQAVERVIQNLCEEA